jgi:hypothetical protein
MPLVNGPWGRLSYVKLPSKRTILRRGEKLADEIRAAAATYGDAVLKDPRFAITLPAWRAHGAEVEEILVCVREPSSVYGSLRKRNRASRGLAMRLWREHNRRLLELADEVPTRFLYYPGLVSAEGREAELAVLSGFLGLDRTAAEWREVLDRSIKPQLDHNPPDGQANPPDVAALWREIMERRARQEPGEGKVGP